ncbi:MAG: TIGR00730 family Rossman fold protein [Candidatus Nomurabacteria bacterium]|jgi:uncharacterized protein (TIGR00730 family)|nr:TIGR00730 family Rossman fold protein [Candidatus Nomurabacteria bacterium]
MNRLERSLWTREIDKRDLSIEEIERLMRYADDLTKGRTQIRQHEEGVSIFGSARTSEGDPDYEKARELGRKLAEAGQVVITGGGGGIMEAGNRGAYEAGGVSIGLNIKLPFEQSLNQYTTDSLEFNYFFARKVMLVDAAKVFVYFSGGFGTLDEFSEVMTLFQTNKATKAPIFLVGSDYWGTFDKMVREIMLPAGYISPEDVDLYKITDDLDEIVAAAKNMHGRKVGDVVDAREYSDFSSPT